MVRALRLVLQVFALAAALLTFTGNLFAGASCTLNPANRTVTLCTPANNATVSTTFHINAGVTDSIAIQYVQVYVNSVLYVTQMRNFVDANITVPGPIANAPVTVQAREVNSTFFIKAHYTLQIVNNNPPPTLTVTPATVTVQEGSTQQFSANRPASWSATCGTINSGGLFTAPLAAGSCTINAVATDGSGTKGSATATVSSSVSIAPPSANTPAGGTQQFTANAAVTWKTSCGTVDATGLFTAPFTTGMCTITATASSGTAFTAQAVDTVGPPPALNLVPANPTLSENATQQFTVTPTAPVNWTASCGAINTAGVYTAPLATGLCTIAATATDGSNRTASTTATITSPLTIAPPSATTKVNATQQFTANATVNWSTSCGTINSAGLFTAPAATGSCTITATAATPQVFTATAIDTVTMGGGGSQNYITWKRDSMRTGLNSTETILTPANVNAAHFGQIWSMGVDGAIYAQPLYMSALTINGVTHNVLFVATETDSVYAFDADNGMQLWKVSFLSPGVTTVPQANVMSTIYPHIGITSTPVIDPTSGTLYVVAETLENSGSSYVHRLHALSLTTGNEKLGGPVLITAAGFQPKEQLQRPGLLLTNGNLYIGIGSHGDQLPYHGWMFAYNASTLGLVSALNITPKQGNPTQGGSIWMGGAAPATDSTGNIYVSTSNGDWDGSQDFSQSVLKLSPALTIIDYFTPFDNAAQSAADKDLGSGGVLVVPDQSGQHPHELIICGKPTPIYVIDRDNMGKFNSTKDNITQRLDNQLGGSTGQNSTEKCFTTAAFWQQNVYFTANNDVLKMFKLDPITGLLSSTPVSKDTFVFAFPGAQPVVSSNGNSNGVVWAIDRTGGTLRAYDATNVSRVLYVSPQIDTGVKWSVPTVVNGQVYVGTQSKITGFGLTKQASCTPPASPGVNVCAPVSGQTSTSPIQITASGTDPTGTVNHMELWIDNLKINDYFSNQINTTVPMAVGAHSATVVEVGPQNAFIKSNAVSFSVQ